MQTIKLADVETITAPPAGQPANPADIPAPGQSTGKPPEIKIPGAVSETDALGAVSGTKISTLTPMNGDPSQFGNMGNSVPVGGMLDAGLALELTDALVPALVVVVFHAFKMEMKKADLQLTAKEKNTLAPLMQKCLDQLMINFNSPFAAFGVAAIVIYGAKITEKGIVANIDKKNEENAKRVFNSQQQAAQPATVVQMQNKFSDPVKPVFSNPSENWEPTPEMFEQYRRKTKHKGTPDQTRAKLKKMYEEGRITSDFLKDLQRYKRVRP